MCLIFSFGDHLPILPKGYLIGSCCDHLAIYVPEVQEVFVWRVIIVPSNSEFYSHLLEFKLLQSFSIFGQVHSLLLTGIVASLNYFFYIFVCQTFSIGTHLIVGKNGCVQLFNWKYVERLKNGPSAKKIKEEKSGIPEDALGRVIYIPKRSAAAKKKHSKDQEFENEKIIGTHYASLSCITLNF